MQIKLERDVNAFADLQQHIYGTHAKRKICHQTLTLDCDWPTTGPVIVQCSQMCNRGRPTKGGGATEFLPSRNQQ